MNSKTTASSARSGARSAAAISRAPLHLWDIVAYWPAVALATVGAATVALAKGRGPRLSPTARVALTSGLGAVTLDQQGATKTVDVTLYAQGTVVVTVQSPELL